MRKNGSVTEKDRVRAAYGDLARAGARKLCAYGNCIFRCYNCGHQKAKLGGSPSLLNPNAVCPVARYQVEDQGVRDWTKCHASELTPSEDEIFALCACCDKSEVTETFEYSEVYRTDLKACMDCPVKAVEECLKESAAEARIS